jgi:hypothetical protein
MMGDNILNGVGIRPANLSDRPIMRPDTAAGDDACRPSVDPVGSRPMK